MPDHRLDQIVTGARLSRARGIQTGARERSQSLVRVFSLARVLLAFSPSAYYASQIQFRPARASDVSRVRVFSLARVLLAFSPSAYYAS